MSARTKRRFVGRFGRRDLELPSNVRFALFTVGLLALGGSYVATESDGVQMVVAIGLIFCVGPVVRRRFGVEVAAPHSKLRQERETPLRLLALPTLLIAPWFAFVFIAGDLGLGDLFWMWALLLPFVEIHTRLAEFEFQRTRGENWRKPRPLRDTLIAGSATFSLITLLVLLDGESVTASLLGGLVCGVIVLGMSAADMKLAKRTATQHSQQGENVPDK